jgi:hypothetical protein
VPVPPGVEGILGVVGVDEIDAPCRRLGSVDHAEQLLTAGVKVAGVQAEADVVAPDRVPEPRDGVDAPGHRVVAAGGVLDQDRHRHVDALERLAPVVEPDLRVVVLGHVTAVDDQRPGTDGRRGIDVLLQQLAARDPDPVVRRGDIDEVRRMHVQVDAGLGRGRTQRFGSAWIGHDRRLVPLRVAEEELRQVRPPNRGFRERIGLVDVSPECEALSHEDERTTRH